jgi:predicted secreted acid phosphatase
MELRRLSYVNMHKLRVYYISNRCKSSQFGSRRSIANAQKMRRVSDNVKTLKFYATSYTSSITHEWSNITSLANRYGSKT